MNDFQTKRRLEAGDTAGKMPALRQAFMNVVLSF
jgi:hypothetical protein